MADEINTDKPNVPMTDSGNFSKGLGLGLPAPIPAAPAEIADMVARPSVTAQPNASQSDAKKE